MATNAMCFVLLTLFARYRADDRTPESNIIAPQPEGDDQGHDAQSRLGNASNALLTNHGSV
jgi:hypothetical protein